MNEQSPLSRSADGPPVVARSGDRAVVSRWRRRLAIVAVIAVAVLACYLARGPLLRTAVSLLISEDPEDRADFVLPLEGARAFAEAARLCRSGQAAGVLLIPSKPEYAQTLGVLPSEEELLHRELTRAGVADGTATTILSPVGSDWNRFRLLGFWLSQHPDARVRLVCGRLQSARCRHILRVVLPKEAAARVRILALAHPEYDETNWWNRKVGVLDVCNSSVSYAHILLCGEDEEKPEWDPDQYEKTLR